MPANYDDTETTIKRSEMVAIAHDAMVRALIELKKGDESLYLYSCTSTLDTTAFNSIQQFIGKSRDRRSCRAKAVKAVKGFLRTRPNFLKPRADACYKAAKIRHAGVVSGLKI